MRYITRFKDKYSAECFFSKNNLDNIIVSNKLLTYFVDVKNEHIFDDEDIVYESRPAGQPLWRPINWGYRIKSGGAYNDYDVYRFIDGFDKSSVNDTEPYTIRGPWYVMTGYLGLLDVWNKTMGSGVMISCQEKFDFTHPGYHTTNIAWSNTDYGTLYASITGGDHEFFFIDSSNIPTITSLLNKCFFYQRGDIYSLTDGSGCINGNLPYYDEYSYFEPTLCYSGWFYGHGFATCVSGLWNWPINNVPSGFSPFGHGDITTSVIASRSTPIDSITGWGDIIANVGIAPKCFVLLGDNQDAYLESESTAGVDIRIGAFDGQWSQLEADAAYATGTILVRPVGSYINCNVVETLGQIVPTNTLSVGSARWRGSDYNIFTQNNTDLTATGNFGMYAGYGRNNYMHFSAPSVRVWCHQPRYNHSGWGAWCGSYDGPSVSSAIGGGLLALMKSLHSDWSWENIITAICQTCTPGEYRTVPPGHSKFGITRLSANLLGGYLNVTGDINVSGNINVVDSVAWYYAYPSGGNHISAFDVTGKPYALLQLETDPAATGYEICYYEDVVTAGTVVSGGGAIYSGGYFGNTYRGYGGTRAKIHGIGGNVYTPLLLYSGWSPYLGWGFPNMKAAIAVNETTLEILPPQRFTVTGLYSAESGHNNKIRLEIVPFRSSNYGGIIVVRNNMWYPQSPTDGTICFQSNDNTSSIITGYDENVFACGTYYTAFQYSKGINVKYSRPAQTACSFINGYAILKSNMFFYENGDSLYIKFPEWPQSTYANTSGYWISADAQYAGFTNNNYLIVTGLSNGDIISISSYTLGNSQNIVGATASAFTTFNSFRAMNWSATKADSTYFNFGNPEHTFVQKYHEGFYGNWSQCLTISGDSTEPVTGWSYIGIEGDNIINDIGCYDTFNFSVYTKILNGSGALNFGINVYDESIILISSLIISSVDISNTTWERYNCTYSSGDEFIGNVTYVHPFVTFISRTPTEFSSALVSNPQITSGEDLLTMSIYKKPSYSEFACSNYINITSGAYIFGGTPQVASGVNVYLYDDYFNINIDRVINETDSGVAVMDVNGKQLALITGYGDFVNSTDVPTYVKTIGKQGAFVSYHDIITHDFRSKDNIHSYININSDGLFNDIYDSGCAPSFVDGETSHNSFLLEIKISDNAVPSGLGILHGKLIIPIEIHRNTNDVGAVVSLWYKYDETIYYMGNTHNNSILYVRKPAHNDLQIQANTLCGTYIESNVLYYSG